MLAYFLFFPLRVVARAVERPVFEPPCPCDRTHGMDPSRNVISQMLQRPHSHRQFLFAYNYSTIITL